jgi:shikimate dehydrogenase
MPRILNFRQELVGVFGFPVSENPTQAMIEPAFEEMGLAWRYLTVEVEPQNLRKAVQGALAMSWRGLNCTIPHKVAVIPFLDELMPAAKAIGAVNCVVIDKGRLIGESTDGKGFLESLSEVVSPKGLEVVVLGAGGAARAIGVEIALAGVESITIVNRSVERGRELVSAIASQTPAKASFAEWTGVYRPPSSTHVLVNATSIGLFPNVDEEVPVDLSTLQKSALVCDVIPNPPRTKLIASAESLGLKTLDGLGMLVNQGVIGIRLWTGKEPKPAVMRKALERVFSE